MAVSLEQIKSLRERTGVSMQSCKKALEESSGDEQKAVDILRKKGEAKIAERGARETGQGAVVSYIHGNGRLGAMVQLGCETDFVSRGEDFQSLAKDIAMHVAASNPLYISSDEVPPELVEKECEFWKSDLAKEKKPEKMWDTIMQGKEKKFRAEVSLLSQPFVKNPEVTVEQVMKDAMLKTGENIRVVRFTRFAF